jgi:lycopene cyclase CruP
MQLKALIRLGILTEEDITKIVGIEFNPNRVGFKADTSGNADKAQGFEVYVQNILNLGVKPNVLIELVKNRFLSGGGTLLSLAILTSVHSHL